MAKKQLDFDAPLLSVRRFSPTLIPTNQNTLPNRRHDHVSIKSGTDLDHITERVAVPFEWEHIPGQSKSSSGPQLQRRYLEESSVFLSLYPQKFENSIEGVDLNDDDAYSDALDKLSQSSFSQNCSVSGISGSDGFDEKPSGTFSADPQTRDFMMRRFLPAAKAMTLETPHYVSRKSSMVPAHEQCSEVKKIVYEDNKPLLIEHTNNKLRYTSYIEQGKGDGESESEDVDYVDDSAIVPVKSCAFLPWFCSKKSVCLLNPVPAMKHVMHYPKASIVSVARRRKISFSGPLCRNTDEHASNAIIQRKVDGAGIKQTVKDNHIWSHPLRKSRDEGSIPHLHPATESFNVPKKGETYKLNRPNMKNKGSDSFQRNLSHHINERGSGSFSPAVEKTLYIDPINIVEYSKPRPKTESACQYLNFDILGESIERKTTITLFQDINTSKALKGNTITEADVSDISHLQDQTKTTKAIKVDQEHLHLESKSSLDCLDIKPDARNNSHVRSSVLCTLPPPLPKSPTESWLWRNPSSTGAKWENIVKTSYLHHDHVRYPELVDDVRN